MTQIDFKVFADALRARFEALGASGAALLVADVDGDLLWSTYLSAFAPGTNPLHKTRTEHDCGCCRHFIKHYGTIVGVRADGEVESLWGNLAADIGQYLPVARALDKLVLGAPRLRGPLRHYEHQVGTAQNRALDENGGTVTWRHFALKLPTTCVMPKAELSKWLGEAITTRQMLERALREFSLENLDTVLDLMAQGSLYRGEEFKDTVARFRDVKAAYENLVDGASVHDGWLWYQSLHLPAAVTRLRNTAIGSLLVDLAEGRELETAVAAYEAKVAPQNYRRPTALVTKAMVERARAALEAQGLLPALERRYAVLEDVAVTDVLWADRSAKAAMRKNGAAGALDALAEEAGGGRQMPKMDRVQTVPAAQFLAEVLPRATQLDVMLENRHAGNLVSLVAPADLAAPLLFKWGNGFSWSYAGDVADSIKERVKRAGGAVTGDLCCRLAWDYADDLDFHMREVDDCYRIYYMNRRTLSPNGGVLDLDANGADGPRSDPAENIVYADRRRMRPGNYLLEVNNYMRRSDGRGFTVEIECDGRTRRYTYAKALRSSETVAVATIKWSGAGEFEVTSSIEEDTAPRQAWNLTTQNWQRVELVTLSPNYWGVWEAAHNLNDDGTPARAFKGVGNRHYMFMLAGCRNPEGARPFYNEFLRDELAEHRKAMEMVGARLRTEGAERQLSGLGFSSTRRDHVLCRVRGAATERVVRVEF